MSSNKETHTGSVLSLRYVKWRNRLVLKLATFHICLVFIFDILAIYAPEFMAASIRTGMTLTTGVLGALLILLSVIISAFYYSYRVNEEFSALKILLKGPAENA